MENTIKKYWQSDRRYYCATLYRDLLGDTVLFCEWGGRFSRLGGRATIPVQSMEEGAIELERIAKRRLKRHYLEVSALRI